MEKKQADYNNGAIAELQSFRGDYRPLVSDSRTMSSPEHIAEHR
jgi:hypothetical protein